MKFEQQECEVSYLSSSHCSRCRPVASTESEAGRAVWHSSTSIAAGSAAGETRRSIDRRYHCIEVCRLVAAAGTADTAASR